MKKIIIDGHGSEEGHFRYDKSVYPYCKKIHSYVEGGQSIDIDKSNHIIKVLLRNGVPDNPDYLFEPDGRLIGDRNLYPRNMIIRNGKLQPQWIIPEAETRNGNLIKIKEFPLWENVNGNVIYLVPASKNENLQIKMTDIINYYQQKEEDFELYWLACRA